MIDQVHWYLSIKNWLDGVTMLLRYRHFPPHQQNFFL